MFRTTWMPIVALAACLTAGTASPGQGSPLGSGERQSLTALETSGLEQLRAASGQLPAGLSSDERASLAQLQSRSSSLEQSRAGEIDDHDMKLILITAAVVVVIAILL